MKVLAASATQGRATAASRGAASSPKPAAKAAQTATAARKTELPSKPVRQVAEKPTAKPAAKATAMSKPAATKAEVKPAETPRPAAAKAGPAVQAMQPPVTSPRPEPAVAGAAPVSPSAERRPIVPDRVPPRPPAKAEVFAEGDHVVYPTHGVGKVERIATEEIAGHKLELIHITFEENRMTLRVPVAKARSAGLRKLATRKLFDEALSVLKGRARIKRTMWSRRAQEYEAKINSGDPLAIAEVVRDLHRNAGQPDQSFSERQIYEAAMDRLAAELAALDKTDKTTAATKLTNFLKTVQ